MKRILGFILLWSAVPLAQASVIPVNASAFVAGSSLITFSEFPLGTVNPTYTPSVYRGGPNDPTVTFGGFFKGQSLGTASQCPAGGARTGCVVGNPSGPLSLSPTSPITFIAGDGSNPTSPVLSGSPQFNGPISILFSRPVVGVGLVGGYFDALQSTAVTAFDATGKKLGSLANSKTGFEFLGLANSGGGATISGLQFSLVGPEPAGFEIDNLRFGLEGQVVLPVTTPEPGTLLLFAFPLMGLAAARRIIFTVR